MNVLNDEHNETRTSMMMLESSSSDRIKIERNHHRRRSIAHHEEPTTTAAHVIPLDDDDVTGVIEARNGVVDLRPHPKKKRLMTLSPPSLRNDDNAIVTDNDAALPSSKRIKKHAGMGNDRLFYEYCSRSVMELHQQTNRIGSQLLLHEANTVRQRTIEWKVRQQQQQQQYAVAATTMASATDAAAAAAPEMDPSWSSFENDVMKESILSQTFRMKRLSILLKQMNQLYDMLHWEIHDCQTSSTDEKIHHQR